MSKSFHEREKTESETVKDIAVLADAGVEEFSAFCRCIYEMVEKNFIW